MVLFAWRSEMWSSVLAFLRSVLHEWRSWRSDGGVRMLYENARPFMGFSECHAGIFSVPVWLANGNMLIGF